MKKTIVLLFACLIFTGCGSTETEEEKTARLVTESKAALSDYDYEIVDDSVKLTKYNGKNEVLYILSEYEADGSEYKTDLSDFSCIVGSSKVKFIIFENGIEEIANATFNSSGIQAVYFPNTMKCVYDTSLRYLHPEEESKIQIYYEGTAEEWNQIFKTYERQRVKEAWNSSDDWEEKGKAVGSSVAEKLNSMMGEYDSSNYEFHYSVDESQLNELIKSYK